MGCMENLHCAPAPDHIPLQSFTSRLVPSAGTDCEASPMGGHLGNAPEAGPERGRAKQSEMEQSEAICGADCSACSRKGM